MTPPLDTGTDPRSQGFATLDEIDARSEVRRHLGMALDALEEWEPWEVERALADAARITSAWRFLARRREEPSR